MKHITLWILILAGLWGCSGREGEAEREQPVSQEPRGQIAQDLTGVWLRPERNINEGIILHTDGTCSFWTRDYEVFQGTWWISGEDSSASELQISMGGGSPMSYPIARYNPQALQLRGSGELSGLLRRGTLGAYQGTAVFRGKAPKGGKLKVVLERWGRLITNERSTEREFVDDFSAPVSKSPMTFTLHYIEELIPHHSYEVRVWIENSGGELRLASDRAHPIKLEEPQSKPVVLRTVRR